MSGEPRDFDKLLGQFGEFETCVSQGLRRVPQKRWQEWIGHSRTGEMTRLFYEMGPEAALVKLGLQEPPTSLFRGLYRTTQCQVTYWHGWLPQLRQEHGVTVSDEAFDTFVANNPAPVWPENKLTTVVLVLRAPSATKEFQLYWPLIAAQQESSWKWDKFIIDEEHVRWLDGSKNMTKEWRFEWQAIDLGANRQTSSEAVRRANVNHSQPNAGILAAAALHPEWIKSMNGNDVPFVDLPGYEASVPDYQLWRNVPRLYFFRGHRQVMLDAHRCDSTNPKWAVPSLAGV